MRFDFPCFGGKAAVPLENPVHKTETKAFLISEVLCSILGTRRRLGVLRHVLATRGFRLSVAL